MKEADLEKVKSIDDLADKKDYLQVAKGTLKKDFSAEVTLFI